MKNLSFLIGLFLLPFSGKAQFGSKYELKLANDQPLEISIIGTQRLYEFKPNGPNQLFNLYVADSKTFAPSNRNLGIYEAESLAPLRLINLNALSEKQFFAEFNLASLVPESLRGKTLEFREQFNQNNQLESNTLFLFRIQ
jgi:hypothetical protein